jgi:mono/diheme cytochrome c family protein
MRYFFLAFLLAAVTVVGIAGFRGDKFSHTPIEIFPDMDHQAKVKAQSGNYFFADGQGSRQPVAGTVPMGMEVAPKTAASGYVAPDGYSVGHGSSYYMTGKMEKGMVWGDGFPDEVKVDEVFLRRGQISYDINCAVCHGKSGNGKGVLSIRQDTPAANYGIANIANFLDAPFTDKANAAYKPNGSVFDTITNGKGLMGRYGNNISVPDRWAIIAYIRAMGLAQNAPVSNPAVKQAWDAQQAANK